MSWHRTRKNESDVKTWCENCEYYIWNGSLDIKFVYRLGETHHWSPTGRQLVPRIMKNQ